MNWLDAWHKQDFAALRDLRLTTPDRFHAAWVPGRRLLFVSRKWHLAGSEVFAHRWGADLTTRDWDVTFVSTKVALSFTDEHLWSYGAIVCVHGAIADFAHRFYNWGALGPRFVGMVNTAPSSGDPVRIADLLICNTQVEARPEESLGNVLVLHPPLDMTLISESSDIVERNGRRDTILQVNLDRRNKNPQIFRYLAEALPQQKFLAIRGVYGDQDVPILPNVEVWAASTTAVRDALLHHTRLVLCPSTKESYGMVIAEALSVGVPCLVSNLPGLRECAGEAALYLDPADPSVWLRGVKLAETWYGKMCGLALARGDTLIRQQAIELDNAHHALERLILTRKG